MSDALFEVITILQLTSSTNEKLRVLESVKSSSLNEDFKTFSLLVYNPYRNYYIKSIPTSGLSMDGTLKVLSEESLEVLDRLSDRSLSGNDALNKVFRLFNKLTPLDQYLLCLIFSRSFKCGVSATLLNKVWPDLIPTFKVMLCTPLTEKSVKKIKWPALVQVKYDAARVAIIVKDGVVQYFTRNGKVYNIDNPQLDSDILSIANNEDLHLDGELYQESGNRVSSNAVTTKFVRDTATKEDNENIRIVLWDLVDLESFTAGKNSIEYETRLQELTKRVLTTASEFVTIATTRSLNSIEEAKEWSSELIATGEEGVIIKNKKSIWEGKRSPNCIKIKEELESDLKIVSLEYGQGKFTEACGAIRCESSDGLVTVSVGSGLNDSLRFGEFHPDNIDKLKDKIITVRHNGIIQDTHGDYSLYLPRFIELREDKDNADDLQKIKDEGK